MIIRIMFCLLWSSLACADNFLICPSVENIRAGVFDGWLPLYIEGEELASKEDQQAFIQGVERFEVARWDTMYLENAHCFYSGKPATRKMILAHDAWRPENSTGWQWKIIDNAAECSLAFPTYCRFIS